jgi:chemotaxis protein MotB
MALSRRSGNRFQASIWPGFVDAMTALLLVLMFVLTIFMIVQFILRETITGQETELHELTAQVASLADALGLEQSRAEGLEADLGRVSASLSTAREEGEAQAALIARLTTDLQAGEAERAGLTARIGDFEAQVARLLAEQEAARGELATLETELETSRGETLSLESALAAARSEIDAGTEAARLAAARAEALEALAADLRRQNAEQTAESEQLAAALSAEEAAKLAEAEAARLLRERLAGSETELTAMTLALDASRKRAEETLTLLAAAEAAKSDLAGRVAELSEAEARAALLTVAEARLAEEQAAGAEAARRVALLNEQIAALRTQLSGLQGVLDAATERDSEAKVQIEALGSQLNTALAQVASEQRRRAELEEAERIRLEEETTRLAAEAARLESEAQNLEQYRSDFFGKLREVLAGREGVRIVGDRFVFSSEVLFEPGSAALAPEGQSQIASVAGLLLDVAAEIPPGIDWVLRVDGHTDDLPLSGAGRYQDNWELSQGRALSVVRFMTEQLGFPPDRLAATGFGEFSPVAEGSSPEARAQNRRIEMKLTER